MSRDSRLWQDSQAHGTIFEGDVAECTKWLGIAKARLRFMLQSTPGATSVTWQPEQDVEIRVDTRPNQITIRTGGAYMESGFLDMLTNGGIGNADTYKPAIIRFNPFVTSKSATLPNASAQRVVADGDKSLAVGCSTKLDHVDVSSESTSYHFDSDPAAFCDPTEIRNKKLCQLRVPPSVYTGKMRLMVQTIYGSKRTDYTYAAESAGMDNLVLAGVSLGISTPTAGLYTAPDGSYWLIKIGTNVTYQKLKISGAYQAAIDGEPLSEAYALSRLVPEPGSSPVTLSGSSLTTALSGYSGPLAYGWKFNASGDKASIVVYGTQSGMSGKIWPTGTTGTAIGIKTALLTVQLGWDSVNLVPTFVSVSTVETGLHMPYNQVKTFFPVMVGSNAYMQCLITDPSHANVINNWYGPIYCYYDKTDALQVIRVRNGGFNTVAADSSQFPLNTQPGLDRQLSLNMRSGTQYPSRTTWGAAGISVGSIVMEGGSTNSTGQTRYKEIQYFEGPRLETSIASLPSADGVYTRYFWNFENEIEGAPPVGIREIYVNGIATSYGSVLIIPFYDAEAVIVSQENTGDHSSVYGNTAYKLSNQYRYHTETWQKTSGAWQYKVADTYPNWTVSDAPAFGSVTDSSTEIEALKGRSSVKRYKAQSARIYGARLDADIVIYADDSGVVPVGTAFPTMDMDVFYDVLASSPILEFPVEVRSSYSGAIKWAVIGSIGDKQDWPNYTYLSPVGWA